MLPRFSTKWQRVRRASPHGRRAGWALRPVIVKSGDDCRQELLAAQLIAAFHSIWQARLPYACMPTITLPELLSFKHSSCWALRPIIVKNGDDCCQELLAAQLIAAFHSIWQARCSTSSPGAACGTAVITEAHSKHVYPVPCMPCQYMVLLGTYCHAVTMAGLPLPQALNTSKRQGCCCS